MAAGVPYLRGLQQHHKKEQRALHHDRRGGAEAQAAKTEKLKDRAGGAFSGSENAPLLSFAEIIALSTGGYIEKVH